ncbi:MAG: ABC transporter ATP-binding protein [Fibrobacterota bacterium]|nr:ABC transporter ATP-binding protein [Chitinispirillaceae bacterium]
MKTTNVLEIRNAVKEYQTPAGSVQALADVSFAAGTGELIAIIGESGSGKSTLLNLINGIDIPSVGDIFVNGENVSSYKEKDRNRWRGKNVGIIFQFFQLIPTLTVCENLVLPMDFCSLIPKKDRQKRARSLLSDFDILSQADKFPFEMSGGQQQRVAIARALANNPSLITADEPTGNLDTKNSVAVFELFRTLQQSGKTIIMVTHNKELADKCDRIIHLQDGKILSDRITNGSKA